MGFSPGELNTGGIPDAPVDGQMYGRQDAAWQPAIRKRGDTMTGPLGLPGNPTLDLEAAPKQYVDTTQALCVLKSGDIMSGPLLLPAVDPLGEREATRKLYVDFADANLQRQINLLATGAVFGGGYDVVADFVSWTALAHSEGLVDGPLPPADTPGIHGGEYLICSTSGTGTGNAPPVPLTAGDQLISGGPGDPDWHVLDVGQPAVTADMVALNPVVAGWTNVQQVVTGLNTGKLNLSGGSMTGGLGFGSVAQATPTDLSRHIALYGTTYGFSITGGTLNYVVGATSNNHVFMCSTSEMARISGNGIILRAGSGGQWPKVAKYDGSNAQDISTHSSVGIGSGTGRLRVFTFNSAIWVRGVLSKGYSNGTTLITFEFYCRGGSPGDGVGTSGWVMELFGRQDPFGALPGIALHRNSTGQGVFCVEAQNVSTGIEFYYEILRGSFLSTGGGNETGTQLGYLSNNMTVAGGA